mgnify:CR=1 FL=1
MKHVLFGILCTIVCKALFPYPSGDFGKPEVVNNRQTSYAGQGDIHNYSPISHIEAEKYIAFPDILICENEETDDEDGGRSLTCKVRCNHKCQYFRIRSQGFGNPIVYSIPFLETLSILIPS